jgi:iron complex outermembrane receptor protein
MGMIDTRGFDNNVSVFIDGAFVSGRAAQNTGMMDLERVEVVKGPQSALYGRNSFAGAINYVTKKPGDEFEGQIEGAFGSDELYQIIGSVSGPIVEDKMSARIAINYENDYGTYDNKAGDDGIGGSETKAVSLALRFTPTDTADILFNVSYSDDFVGQLPLTNGENNCGELNVNPATSADYGLPHYQCGELTPGGTDTLTKSPGAYSSKGDTTRFSLNMDFDVGDYTITSISAYTDMDYHGNTDLDGGDQAAGSYGYGIAADFEAYFDTVPLFPFGPSIWDQRVAGGPTGSAPMVAANFFFPFLDIVPFAADTYLSGQNNAQQYLSQEVRIESNTEERFRWSAGAFYFQSESSLGTGFNVDVSEALALSGLDADELIFMNIQNPFPGGFVGISHIPLPQPSLDGPSTGKIWTAGSNPNNLLTLSESKVTQYAFFGSAEYDFTDQLTGTAELRWTSDDRENLDVIDDFFFTLGTWIAADVPAYAQIKHEYWDPRFILSYGVNDDAMVYASASHGTRSGGINVNLDFGIDPFFDPEENWTYEVGAKTTWLDGTVQINGSAFFIDWTEAQFRSIVPQDGGSFLTVTQNSEGLEVKGFELDAVYVPNDHWLISGGYGYADAEFADGTFYSGGKSFCALLPAGPSIPMVSSDIPQMPINCVLIDEDGDGVGDTLYPDMSGLMPKRTSKHTAYLAVEYRQPMTADADAFVRVDASYRSKQFVDDMNVSYVPSRTVMNLRAGVETENYEVTFWVENLLDDDKPLFGQLFGRDFNSLRTVATTVNPSLRRIGVTGRYRF